MRLITILFALLIFLTSAVAQTTHTGFSIEQANRSFDQISIKLSTENLQAPLFESAIESLQNLTQQAEQCQVTASQELEQINTKLNVISPAQAKLTDQVDVSYLEAKKVGLVKREAQCRLFVIRASEALGVYKTTLAQLTKSELLSRHTPIWSHYSDSTVVSNVFHNFRLATVLNPLTQLVNQHGLMLLGLLVLGVFFSISLWSLFNYLITNSKSSMSYLTLYVLRYYSLLGPLLLIGLFAAVIFYWCQWLASPVFVLMASIATYGLYQAVIKLILYPCPRAAESETEKAFALKRSLYRRMNLLGVITLLGGGFYYLLIYAETAQLITLSMHTLLITLLALNMVWITWILNSLAENRALAVILSLLFSTIFLFIVGAEWVGYYQLAEYLLFNFFLTVFGWLGVMLLLRIINKLIAIPTGYGYAWQNRLRYYLGLSDQGTLPELSILRVLGVVLVCLTYVAFLLEVWGRNSRYPDAFASALVNGFNLASIPVFPVKIMIAVVVFVALCLFGRWLSTYILHANQRRSGQNAQVALASITSYVSFAVALIIALLVAGVNFTGLAIIAGALSVGIGLGLQDIVNNFVSGLILLIEKPIKVGDRVVIGETEGFVKKVRIRSTQITTLSKSDVIVPNSDLVKYQVINYMFRDRNWRVACRVGVAYGSDVDKVKALMLEVGRQHPDVIQTGSDEPIVLFKQFADSSLNFELWCVINDVNKKFIVESDLHFAIDAAFRAADITIAFPQRDVHLYNHSLIKPADT